MRSSSAASGQWVGVLVLITGASVASAEPAQQATDLNNQGVAIAHAGRLEDGIGLLRQARQVNPADEHIRRNLSGMLTDWAIERSQAGDIARAMTSLEEAVQQDPANGRAFVILGNLAFLTQDDLSRAIEFWTRAHGNIPADKWKAVAQRLAQAERDRAIERAFGGVTTAHFRIRFEGDQHRDLAEGVGGELEQLYQRLAGGFGNGPAVLTVLLYTDRAFERVAGRRDWAAGLYDGRIRLRADELSGPLRTSVMAHELAHAFLARAYGHRLPTWVQEGFAQSQEPREALTATEQHLLQEAAARQSWIPLKWLDRRFDQPSNREDLERAYVQSRWVVEQLLERKGMSAFRDFLARLSSAAPVDRAFDATMSPLRWSRVDIGNFE